MKPIILNIARKLFYLATIIVVVVAVFLTVLRAMSPLLNNYRSEISQFASSIVHNKVTVGSVDAYWRRGTPIIRFQDMDIYNARGDKIVLHVSEVGVSLNILGSLYNLRLEPEFLIISGAHFNLYQDHDDHFRVAGLTRAKSNNQQKSNDLNTQHLLDWILTKNQLLFRDIDINWYRPDNSILRLQDIDMGLINKGDEHRLLGKALLGKDHYSTIQFILKAQGDYKEPASLQIRSYLSANNLDIAHLLSPYGFNDYAIKQGLMSFKVWGQWRNGHAQAVHGSLGLHNFLVYDNKHRVSYSLPELSGDVLWQYLQQGWQLQGDHIVLQLPNHSWPQNKLQVRYLAANAQQPAQYGVYLKYANIGDLIERYQRMHFSNNRASKQLKALQLQGELHNIYWLNSLGGSADNAWQLSTGLKNFSNRRDGHIPGLGHVSGQLQVTPEQGQFILASDNSQFDFGSLFPKSIHLNRLTGNINWQKVANAWHVTATQVILSNNDLDGSARMSLNLPKGKASPDIELLASVNIADSLSAASYLPVGILDKNLVTWLDSAIGPGGGAVATLVLRGPLKHFPYQDQSGTFLIDGNVFDTLFDYQKGYPPIEHTYANLIFRDASMNIRSRSGSILGARINDATAVIPELGGKNMALEINGDVSGDLSQGMAYIFQSPLNDVIGKDLSGMKLSGPLKLKLGLHIPLEDEQAEIGVTGKAQMRRALFQMPQWHLSINQLNGLLNFTQNGLSAPDLKGRFYNQPIHLAVKTVSPKQGADYTNVDIKGQLSVKSMSQQWSSPLFDFLIGQTPFTGNVRVYHDTGEYFVKLHSNLKGVAVSLPQPFRKAAKHQVPSAVELLAKPKQPLQLFINYGARIATSVVLQENQAIQKAKVNVQLGTAKAARPQHQGITVTGRLQQLIWEQWQPVMDDLTKKTTTNSKKATASPLPPFKNARLRINRLSMGQHTIRDAVVTAAPRVKSWRYGISSQQLSGYVIWPDSYPYGKVTARFSHVYIPKSNSKGSNSKLNPKSLPSIDGVVDKLYYGNKTLGKVVIKATRAKHGLTINNFSSRSSIMNVQLKGYWHNLRGHDATKINGQLNTKNYGKLLSYWDLSNNLVGKEGDVDYSLSWVGSPADFELANLEGNVDIKLKEGRVKDIGAEANKEMGVGKALSILGLQTIPRRFKGDFSDLTNPGYSFDKMEGYIALHRGVATLTKTYLNGPVAMIRLSGDLGLARQTLNLKLSITPYVTSSLPVVATLVGTPILGAVVWGVNKLAEPELNKLTTYHYRVTGMWDGPKVEKLK